MKNCILITLFCLMCGYTNSQSGNLLNFDGSSHVLIGNVSELNYNPTHRFTVEAWIRSTGSSSTQQIISKFSGSYLNPIGWGLMLNGSTPTFYMGGGGLFNIIISQPIGTPDVTNGEWHHIAVVYTGGRTPTSCTFYIDGVRHKSQIAFGSGFYVFDLHPNTQSAAIGAYSGSYGTSQFFEGDLEEVRVWDGIRTAHQIRSNLHLTVEPSEPSLAGYWRFNDATGPVSDLANGNSGVLLGAVLDDSTAPLGSGISTSHLAISSGTVYKSGSTLAHHSADLSFATTPPGGRIVVTYIEEEANALPSGLATYNLPSYWIIDNYGPNNSGLDGSLRFNYPDGFITNPILSSYKLHKRGRTDFKLIKWSLNNASAYAIGTVGGGNFIRYSNITSDGMFVPSSEFSTLPVELSDFNVRKLGDKQAEVYWVTALEQNSFNFEVQRSAEGIDWQTVSTIAAAGNSETKRRYRFIDEQPLSNTSYYRLKMIDKDGKVEFSDVKSITFNSNFTVALSPNPTSHTVTLSFDGSEPPVVRFQNGLGQMFLPPFIVGIGKSDFDVSSLPKGLYFVTIISENSQETIQLVIK